jgi:hypothetical protein
MPAVCGDARDGTRRQARLRKNSFALAENSNARMITAMTALTIAFTRSNPPTTRGQHGRRPAPAAVAVSVSTPILIDDQGPVVRPVDRTGRCGPDLSTRRCGQRAVAGVAAARTAAATAGATAGSNTDGTM